jgi:hypothetical protein
MDTVKLNQTAFKYAKQLIADGKYVPDEMDDWSEHRPSADQENEYIEEHGYTQYAHWYLGIDTSRNPNTKQHYKFPYGDFIRVHRCGILAAEVRAAQNGYADIKSAAAHLHGMLDAKK